MTHSFYNDGNAINGINSLDHHNRTSSSELILQTKNNSNYRTYSQYNIEKDDENYDGNKKRKKLPKGIHSKSDGLKRLNSNNEIDYIDKNFHSIFHNSTEVNSSFIFSLLSDHERWLLHQQKQQKQQEKQEQQEQHQQINNTSKERDIPKKKKNIKKSTSFFRKFRKKSTKHNTTQTTTITTTAATYSASTTSTTSCEPTTSLPIMNEVNSINDSHHMSVDETIKEKKRRHFFQFSLRHKRKLKPESLKENSFDDWNSTKIKSSTNINNSIGPYNNYNRGSLKKLSNYTPASLMNLNDNQSQSTINLRNGFINKSNCNEDQYINNDPSNQMTISAISDVRLNEKSKSKFKTVSNEFFLPQKSNTTIMTTTTTTTTTTITTSLGQPQRMNSQFNTIRNYSYESAVTGILNTLTSASFASSSSSTLPSPSTSKRRTGTSVLVKQNQSRTTGRNKLLNSDRKPPMAKKRCRSNFSTLSSYDQSDVKLNNRNENSYMNMNESSHDDYFHIENSGQQMEVAEMQIDNFGGKVQNKEVRGEQKNWKYNHHRLNTISLSVSQLRSTSKSSIDTIDNMKHSAFLSSSNGNSMHNCYNSIIMPYHENISTSPSHVDDENEQINCRTRINSTKDKQMKDRMESTSNSTTGTNSNNSNKNIFSSVILQNSTNFASDVHDDVDGDGNLVKVPKIYIKRKSSDSRRLNNKNETFDMARYPTDNAKYNDNWQITKYQPIFPQHSHNFQDIFQDITNRKTLFPNHSFTSKSPLIYSIKLIKCQEINEQSKLPIKYATIDHNKMTTNKSSEDINEDDSLSDGIDITIPRFGNSNVFTESEDEIIEIHSTVDKLKNELKNDEAVNGKEKTEKFSNSLSESIDSLNTIKPTIIVHAPSTDLDDGINSNVEKLFDELFPTVTTTPTTLSSSNGSKFTDSDLFISKSSLFDEEVNDGIEEDSIDINITTLQSSISSDRQKLYEIKDDTDSMKAELDSMMIKSNDEKTENGIDLTKIEDIKKLSFRSNSSSSFSTTSSMSTTSSDRDKHSIDDIEFERIINRERLSSNFPNGNNSNEIIPTESFEVDGYTISMRGSNNFLDFDDDNDDNVKSNSRHFAQNIIDKSVEELAKHASYPTFSEYELNAIKKQTVLNDESMTEVSDVYNSSSTNTSFAQIDSPKQTLFDEQELRKDENETDYSVEDRKLNESSLSSSINSSFTELDLKSSHMENADYNLKSKDNDSWLMNVSLKDLDDGTETITGKSLKINKDELDENWLQGMFDEHSLEEKKENEKINSFENFSIDSNNNEIIIHKNELDNLSIRSDNSNDVVINGEEENENLLDIAQFHQMINSDLFDEDDEVIETHIRKSLSFQLMNSNDKMNEKSERQSESYWIPFDETNEENDKERKHVKFNLEKNISIDSINYSDNDDNENEQKFDRNNSMKDEIEINDLDRTLFIDIKHGDPFNENEEFVSIENDLHKVSNLDSSPITNWYDNSDATDNDQSSKSEPDHNEIDEFDDEKQNIVKNDNFSFGNSKVYEFDLNMNKHDNNSREPPLEFMGSSDESDEESEVISTSSDATSSSSFHSDSNEDAESEDDEEKIDKSDNLANNFFTKYSNGTEITRELSATDREFSFDQMMNDDDNSQNFFDKKINVSLIDDEKIIEKEKSNENPMENIINLIQRPIIKIEVEEDKDTSDNDDSLSKEDKQVEYKNEGDKVEEDKDDEEKKEIVESQFDIEPTNFQSNLWNINNMVNNETIDEFKKENTSILQEVEEEKIPTVNDKFNDDNINEQLLMEENREKKSSISDLLDFVETPFVKFNLFNDDEESQIKTIKFEKEESDDEIFKTNIKSTESIEEMFKVTPNENKLYNVHQIDNIKLSKEDLTESKEELAKSIVDTAKATVNSIEEHISDSWRDIEEKFSISNNFKLKDDLIDIIDDQSIVVNNTKHHMKINGDIENDSELNSENGDLFHSNENKEIVDSNHDLYRNESEDIPNNEESNKGDSNSIWSTMGLNFLKTDKPEMDEHVTFPVNSNDMNEEQNDEVVEKFPISDTSKLKDDLIDIIDDQSIIFNNNEHGMKTNREKENEEQYDSEVNSENDDLFHSNGKKETFESYHVSDWNKSEDIPNNEESNKGDSNSIWSTMGLNFLKTDKPEMDEHVTFPVNSHEMNEEQNDEIPEKNDEGENKSLFSSIDFTPIVNLVEEPLVKIQVAEKSSSTSDDGEDEEKGDLHELNTSKNVLNEMEDDVVEKEDDAVEKEPILEKEVGEKPSIIEIEKIESTDKDENISTATSLFKRLSSPILSLKLNIFSSESKEKDVTDDEDMNELTNTQVTDDTNRRENETETMNEMTNMIDTNSNTILENNKRNDLMDLLEKKIGFPKHNENYSSSENISPMEPTDIHNETNENYLVFGDIHYSSEYVNKDIDEQDKNVIPIWNGNDIDKELHLIHGSHNMIDENQILDHETPKEEELLNVEEQKNLMNEMIQIVDENSNKIVENEIVEKRNLLFKNDSSHYLFNNQRSIIEINDDWNKDKTIEEFINIDTNNNDNSHGNENESRGDNEEDDDDEIQIPQWYLDAMSSTIIRQPAMFVSQNNRSTDDNMKVVEITDDDEWESLKKEVGRRSNSETRSSETEKCNEEIENQKNDSVFDEMEYERPKSMLMSSNEDKINFENFQVFNDRMYDDITNETDDDDLKESTASLDTVIDERNKRKSIDEITNKNKSWKSSFEEYMGNMTTNSDELNDSQMIKEPMIDIEDSSQHDNETMSPSNSTVTDDAKSLTHFTLSPQQPSNIIIRDKQTEHEKIEEEETKPENENNMENERKLSEYSNIINSLDGTETDDNKFSYNTSTDTSDDAIVIELNAKDKTINEDKSSDILDRSHRWDVSNDEKLMKEDDIILTSPDKLVKESEYDADNSDNHDDDDDNENLNYSNLFIKKSIELKEEMNPFFSPIDDNEIEVKKKNENHQINIIHIKSRDKFSTDTSSIVNLTDESDNSDLIVKSYELQNVDSYSQTPKIPAISPKDLWDELMENKKTLFLSNDKDMNDDLDKPDEPSNEHVIHSMQLSPEIQMDIREEMDDNHFEGMITFSDTDESSYSNIENEEGEDDKDGKDNSSVIDMELEMVSDKKERSDEENEDEEHKMGTSNPISMLTTVSSNFHNMDHHLTSYHSTQIDKTNDITFPNKHIEPTISTTTISFNDNNNFTTDISSIKLNENVSLALSNHESVTSTVTVSTKNHPSLTTTSHSNVVPWLENILSESKPHQIENYDVVISSPMTATSRNDIENLEDVEIRKSITNIYNLGNNKSYFSTASPSGSLIDNGDSSNNEFLLEDDNEFIRMEEKAKHDDTRPIYAKIPENNIYDVPLSLNKMGSNSSTFNTSQKDIENHYEYLEPEKLLITSTISSISTTVSLSLPITISTYRSRITNDKNLISTNSLPNRYSYQSVRRNINSNDKSNELYTDNYFNNTPERLLCLDNETMDYNKIRNTNSMNVNQNERIIQPLKSESFNTFDTSSYGTTNYKIENNKNPSHQSNNRNEDEDNDWRTSNLLLSVDGLLGGPMTAPGWCSPTVNGETLHEVISDVKKHLSKPSRFDHSIDDIRSLDRRHQQIKNISTLIPYSYHSSNTLPSRYQSGMKSNNRQTIEKKTIYKSNELLTNDCSDSSSDQSDHNNNSSKHFYLSLNDENTRNDRYNTSNSHNYYNTTDSNNSDYHKYYSINSKYNYQKSFGNSQNTIRNNERKYLNKPYSGNKSLDKLSNAKQTQMKEIILGKSVGNLYWKGSIPRRTVFRTLSNNTAIYETTDDNITNKISERLDTNKIIHLLDGACKSSSLKGRTRIANKVLKRKFTKTISAVVYANGINSLWIDSRYSANSTNEYAFYPLEYSGAFLGEAEQVSIDIPSEASNPGSVMIERIFIHCPKRYERPNLLVDVKNIDKSFKMNNSYQNNSMNSNHNSLTNYLHYSNVDSLRSKGSSSFTPSTFDNTSDNDMSYDHKTLTNGSLDSGVLLRQSKPSKFTSHWSSSSGDELLTDSGGNHSLTSSGVSSNRNRKDTKKSKWMSRNYYSESEGDKRFKPLPQLRLPQSLYEEYERHESSSEWSSSDFSPEQDKAFRSAYSLSPYTTTSMLQKNHINSINRKDKLSTFMKKSIEKFENFQNTKDYSENLKLRKSFRAEIPSKFIPSNNCSIDRLSSPTTTSYSSSTSKQLPQDILLLKTKIENAKQNADLHQKHMKDRQRQAIRNAFQVVDRRSQYRKAPLL
ncbi:hypothetical protein SNEBB_004702 [Seison nebaliae]|nr:hypothetical protein SNEBB_004702 [Seison nebaliae]